MEQARQPEGTRLASCEPSVQGGEAAVQVPQPPAQRLAARVGGARPQGRDLLLEGESSHRSKLFEESAKSCLKSMTLRCSQAAHAPF
jgi:hypothetical protein